ncbi:MAG: ATP synthase F0 subunit B [Haliea sp.]|uniref:ATP synthase F0 subunit B n=1 Tax=Haliea sp. TaxID=1932666 RepID=UPI0032EF709D
MNFDWTTFALQLVNVLILLAILRRFLFRPVAAIIEKRRAETQATLDAAAAARAEAEQATTRARAEADASAAARHDLLLQAAAEAQTQRAMLIEKARAEAARIVEDGRAALAREGASAEQRTLAQVRELAIAVASRALSAQPDGPEGYAVRLGNALRRMEASERDALLRAGDLTLVSARELPEAVLGTVRHTLQIYGVTARVTTDPALIDGIELRSKNGALRNSLAHDLEALARAMHDVRTES